MRRRLVVWDLFPFRTIADLTCFQGPGGGAILQNYGPKLQWTGLWIYGGVACAVAAAMFTVVRMMKAGGKLMVKV